MQLRTRVKSFLSALAVAALCAACDRSSELRTPPWTPTNEAQPGAATLRRLSRDELAGTYRALIGSVPESIDRLPPDASALGMNESPVSSFEVEVYREIADEAARAAAPTLLQRWGCQGDRECMKRSASAWLERAQRRELPDADRQTYLAFLTSGSEDDLRRLLDLTFQTPHFLYVIESTQSDTIGAWELATRLSYVLWSEPPDDILLADAKSGALTRPEVLARQADRMLADARAARSVGTTLGRWAAPELAIAAKAYSVYPQFDANVRASMTEQLEQFAALALREHWSLTDLLTTKQAPLDATLAKLLGVPKDKLGDVTKNNWSTVTMEEPRFGLLTLPAVLSARARSDDSSPVQRGLLIRDGMLCQPMPDPPPGVAALPPAASADATFRERLQAHTSDATCASCHRLMDPLGFPFEIYDGIGRLRKNRAQIATAGKLDGVAVPADFPDLQGLVDALLATPELPACWATHWVARVLGREAAQNGELVERVTSRFAAGAPLRDILLDLITSPELRTVTRR